MILIPKAVCGYKTVKR